LAIMIGTPRDASARKVCGQSSVSMQIRNAGSIDDTARRTTQGKSSGKKRCVTSPAKRSRTTRAPVLVTVVITSGSSGCSRRSPSTSGAAAIASPTDTACNQPDRRPGCGAASPPSRAHALSGTPRVKRRTSASGIQIVRRALSATTV
jgi:hypothetical protein